MLLAFINKLIKIIMGQSNDTDTIMHLQCELLSRKGSDKEVNEDSFLVDRYANNLDAESVQSYTLTSDLMHIFAVFDGVSSGGNGKESSEIAAESLKRILDYNTEGFDDSFIAAVDAAIRDVNLSIYNAFSAQSESKQGTTMAMIIVYRSNCIVFNVGDSRIYRLTDGSLIQLSYDHTLENYKRQLGFMKKDPFISKKDGATLYQCLGKDVSIDYYKYGPFKYKSGDRFFICSDGISGFLDRKILLTLLQADSGHTLVDLSEAAYQAGSLDDQTSIMISID